LTNKKAAPAQEQPSNQLPNSTAEQTVEQQVLEAIRRGLFAAGVEHDHWERFADRILWSLKEAGLLKPDLESIVRTVEPEARTRRFMSVYYPWPHRRTLAEAQRVAAALVAEYGGSVETMRFSKSPKEGAVRVTACGTDISIYFEDEEGAQ
jgi:hypothetical protein